MSVTLAPAPTLADRTAPQRDRTIVPEPVRVLHVVPSLFGGGMERAMLRLIEGLEQRRHTQQETRPIVQGVCILQNGDDALMSGSGTALPVWELGWRGSRSLKSRWRLIGRLREVMDQFRADVVHARTTAAWFDTVLAAGRRSGRRVLLSFHGKTEMCAPSWPRRRLNRWLCRQADAVLAVSWEAGKMMAGQWGVPVDRLFVIHNGVDSERFHPACDDVAAQESDGRAGSIVACVANHHPIKNIDGLLEAWRHVAMAYPEARLWLIGDGPLRDALEARARQLRCRQSVEFWGARDDVPELLRRADLFVLPSRYEACPNAVLEAMATGLPVIACDAGGTGELIESNRTGRLVAPGQVDPLAEAIIELLRDERMRIRLGRAAHRYVIENHSMKHWLDDYTAVYRTLAER